MRVLKLKEKIMVTCLIPFSVCWSNQPYIFLASFTRERSCTGPANTFTANYCHPNKLARPF